ncbi:hypothetical protein SDRG_08268 [Saprolegnia diclina VS20]|uniref:F-box domain-containing protein n=1 Tax=Saprolegnia diclina (strain VS20) TaxID=1156394 RepID=T0Q869_SAPDV|nr:hypothetical protein SDRG_08268 [Saprolegnia diclina VS20]EQC34054.1 hypothetical protein SDRG_08268 [Saprolegnia diclina VS20]|eukprot:XP_008612366.1 hypothetical protein SDRG_08268 [Saprolegnia diclina VS20]
MAQRQRHNARDGLTADIFEIIATFIPEPRTFLDLLHTLPEQSRTRPLQSVVTIATTPSLRRVVEVVWPTLVLTTRALPPPTLDLLRSTLSLGPRIDWDCGIVGRAQMDLIATHFVPYLRSVYLHVNTTVLAGDNGPFFRDLLLSCPRLEKLDLRYDSEDTDPRMTAAIPLFQVLAHPRLCNFSLVLPHNDYPYEVDARLGLGLAAFLRTGRARDLVLKNLFLDTADDPDLNLSRVLQACTSLQHLTLYNVAVVPDDNLWAHLPPSLCSLKVYDNTGEDDVVDGLVMSLPRMRNLTELKLEVVFVTQPPRILAPIVRSLTQLKSVNLSGCTLPNAPCLVDVVSAFGSLSILERLDLTGLDAVSSAMTALLTTLRHCRRLQSLRLASTSLSTKDVHSILATVPECPCLTHLDLSDNEPSDNWTSLLPALEAAARTLRGLNMRSTLDASVACVTALGAMRCFKLRLVSAVQASVDLENPSATCALSL